MKTHHIRFLSLAGAFCAAGLVAAQAASPQFTVSSPQYKLVPLHRHAMLHHAPQIRDILGYSTNWGGYAAENSISNPALGDVTTVTGDWTVPKATGIQGSEYQYSSAWVGIDGYLDSQLWALFSNLTPQQQQEMELATETVEQIGTEQDWTGTGDSYYAWFEFYPNYSYLISGFTVKAGDGIAASVKYLGSNNWALTLENFTRKETVTITGTFTADRYSAEWIIEAPSDQNGILPLADFGKITFGTCTATIKGKALPIGKASWEALDMIDSGGSNLKASVSNLNTAGTGFTATWYSN